MIFFGASIAKANEVGEKSSKRGPANLLQQMPDTFTYAQAEMVRLQNDFGKKGTAMMLRNWVNRHYIEKIPPKGANADGTDGKQGGKVFSIQLFSFKKLCAWFRGYPHQRLINAMIASRDRDESIWITIQ